MSVAMRASCGVHLPITALLLQALLPLCVEGATLPGTEDARPSKVFACVVDAGSSHTGVSFFEIGPKADEYQLLHHMTVEGGVGQAATEHGPHHFRSYVLDVLDEMKMFWKTHGVHSAGDVVVFLRATAGLRVLGAEQAANILKQFQQMTREAGFIIGDAFRVMEGTAEGIYGWMSANRDIQPGEVGDVMLDLGGGSTQLAAEVNEDAAAQTEEFWFRGRRRFLLSESYLGYGLQKKLSDTIERLGSPFDVTVQHPLEECKPGSPAVFQACMREIDTSLQQFPPGDGSISRLLWAIKPPQLVHGLSAFWYVVKDLFPSRAEAKASLDLKVKDLKSRVQAYCGTLQPPKPGRSALQVCRCFSGCYLLSLLSTYGIGGDDVTLRVSRIDWTIGFLIHVAETGRLHDARKNAQTQVPASMEEPRDFGLAPLLVLAVVLVGIVGCIRRRASGATVSLRPAGTR